MIEQYMTWKEFEKMVDDINNDKGNAYELEDFHRYAKFIQQNEEAGLLEIQFINKETEL